MKIEMGGKRFGKLVVLWQDGYRNQQAAWKCLCDCGNVTTQRGSDLRTGHTVSCGCHGRSIAAVSARKHGHAAGKRLSRVYRIWANMLTRCTNINTPAFKWYGARGIAACDRWRSFECFLEDMGEPPSDKHSLDRIDNDGNYEPANCRWATASEQRRNSRSIKLSLGLADVIRSKCKDGVSVSAIASEFGVSRTLVAKVRDRRLWA